MKKPKRVNKCQIKKTTNTLKQENNKSTLFKRKNDQSASSQIYY